MLSRIVCKGSRCVNWSVSVACRLLLALRRQPRAFGGAHDPAPLLACFKDLCEGVSRRDSNLFDKLIDARERSFLFRLAQRLEKLLTCIVHRILPMREEENSGGKSSQASRHQPDVGQAKPAIREPVRKSSER